MKDLTVTLENRPGRLADLGEATGSSGINIEAGCGSPEGGQAAVHILVDDVDATRAALSKAGFEVSGERDVLVVDVEDRPGAMGEVARRVAGAGANIELVYTTFGAVRLVLGVDDLEKARARPVGDGPTRRTAPAASRRSPPATAAARAYRR